MKQLLKKGKLRSKLHIRLKIVDNAIKKKSSAVEKQHASGQGVLHFWKKQAILFKLKGKRRFKFKSESGYIYVLHTRRNVLVTVCDAKHKVLYWFCPAKLGFKKAQRRPNRQINDRICKRIVEECKQLAIRKFTLVVRGYGYLIFLLVRKLKRRKIKALAVIGDMFLSKNGVKPRKSRRL